MDPSRFLDEFRPFRRGELALARRQAADPGLLPTPQLDLLRHALRLAQLSALDRGRIDLVGRFERYRLELIQRLAPVLPTEEGRIDPAALAAVLPDVAKLAGEARAQLLAGGVLSESALDAEIADKRLVLILGGAGGCGYVYLGALQRLEELALVPRYIVGCSLGAILGVLRARIPELSLAELFDEVRLLSAAKVFSFTAPRVRYGFTGAMGLDLRQSLGHLFARDDGSQLRLRDLEIPVDVLVSGVSGSATAGALPDAPGLESLGSRSSLSVRGLARLRDSLVSLIVSQRLLKPLLLGADAETAELPALDAAGFSSAIPYLLHYQVPDAEGHAGAIVERLFARHELVALIDGVMTSTTPARQAWQAVEEGRIGTRNTAIVALHAMQAGRGATRLVLAPLQHAVSTTVQRDKPFWDVGVAFRRSPSLLELFPRESALRQAVKSGRAEFEPAARLLSQLLAPLPPWRELGPSA
jgi:hypothetical protein